MHEVDLMTPEAIDELIEIQRQLAELKEIASTLDPETARVLREFIDRTEARARELDKMS